MVQISPTPAPIRMTDPRVERMYGQLTEVYLAQLAIAAPLDGGVQRFEGRYVNQAGHLVTFHVANNEGATFLATGTKPTSVT